MTNQYGEFIIISPVEIGGYGEVYAALRKGDNKAYILKTIRNIKKDKKDNIDDLINIVIKSIQNEIDILEKLNEEPKNECVPTLYYYNKYNINKEINNNKAKPFYVIDYYSKDNLFVYLYHLNKCFYNGFSEKHAKIIFKKILNGIQFCHNKKICHFDIKPGNIVFDKNYEPVIIDFSVSEQFEDSNSEKIYKQKMCTDNYKSPELWMEIPQKISGIKCDVFSLGAVLFNLVTAQFGFRFKKNDYLYKEIINGKSNNYSDYWNKLSTKYKIDINALSDNFKKLYTEMIAFKPEDRPTIDKILNSDWMKEINNLSQKEYEALEKEVKIELNKIYNEIRDEENEINKVEELNFLGYETRSDRNNEKGIFTNKKLKPKKIPKERLEINHFVKIKGKLEETTFMNCLVEKIREYKKESFIQADKESLKFDVIFEKEYIKEGEEEEEKEICSCQIQIELFEYEDGYYFEFLRKGGDVQEYYEYFLEIKKIIKKLISN